jgi:FkbM family methyltransferase
MVAPIGHANLTLIKANLLVSLEKLKIHVEDVIWNLNWWARLQLLFAILYRRKVPIPGFIFRFFYSYNLNADSGFAPEDEKFLEEYIVPERNKLFVDIGAYRGQWTQFVAKSGIEVHAFEPSPIPYAVLAEKAKKYTNFYTYHCALGDRDSEVTLSLAPFSLLGLINEKSRGREKNTVNVPIRTLDEFKLADVGVIKIDTEGYEVPILMGAKETILKNRPRLVIEVHKGTGNALRSFSEESHRIENILSNLGYSYKVHYRRVGDRDMQPFIIGNPDVSAEPQDYQGVIAYDANTYAIEVSS